jgi:hypothetical protein
MPIHNWTRVSPGGFHNFHQNWVNDMYRGLNRGVLPPGYTAYTDTRVSGLEPDVVAIQAGAPPTPVGLAVADAPPRTRQVARVETDSAAYARKADRITIRHEYGQVVAIIEIVPPGNKDSRHAIRAFTAKAVEFLRAGVNLLVIDLFPPTPRDPAGIHQVIWSELTDDPFAPRPGDKPLTVAAFAAGDDLTAYVDPVAVGDRLPDGPLFLAPGWYINVPLESTYQTAWEGTPAPIREAVAAGDPPP